MTKTLTRRLDKLEEQLRPGEEPRRWQVVIVHSDGTQEPGPLIERSPTRGSEACRKREEGDSQTAGQA